MYSWATNIKRLIFAPAYIVESDEDRRRIQMLIMLTGFHLMLIILAGLQFLVAGQLPIPVVIQFILNSAILSLIYTHFFEVSIRLLIVTYVISNFVALFFSDLNNLMYSVTAFVAVSILLKRKFRLPYALLMISMIVLLGYLTSNNPQYAVVTHENVIMFAVLGILSVTISTSVIDGDLHQISNQHKSLHQNEERYRLLAENISDMVTLHNLEGRFLYVSPSYARATGYNEGELLAMDVDMLSELVHPDDLQRTQLEAHQQLLDGKIITKLEYRRRKKDGNYFWVEAHSTPVFDDSGKVTQILSSTRDITERKNAQEALASSEERYRQMFDGNRTVKMVIEPNTGSIKDVNAAAVKFYGYSLDQFKSMQIEDLNAWSHENMLEAMQRAFAEGRSFFEFRHRLASGEVRDVDIFSSPVDTVEGPYLYFIVIDVTGKREIELRYRSLFEQSNDAVFILDLEANHVQVNQRAANMLGYPLEEIIGLSYRDMVVPQQHELSNNVLQRLLAGETVLPYERIFRRKDGAFLPTEINVEVVRDREGNPLHIQSIVRDITERKQMEEALKRSESQLAEAQQITHLGSWRWDISSNIIRWSNELYRIFGVTPEEFCGTYEEYLAILHPDDRDFVHEQIQEAYRKHQSYSLYHRIIHPQNNERIIHGMGQVLTDEQDHVIGMIGTAQDVTEEKRNEEALSIRNKYLTTLYQITLDLLNRHEIGDLLQALVVAAATILDAPYGELMLKEDDTLVVKTFTDNQPFLVGDRVKRNEAFLAWQAHDTLAPAILEDYSRWSMKREIYDGLPLRAVADFPITVDNMCIGVLGLARSQENQPFTPEQIQIGMMFSQLAALVVDNANQYSAAVQEITERKKTEARLHSLTQELQETNRTEYEQRLLAETLRDTAAALNTTLELDEILKLILENIKRIIPHDAANVMLISAGIARVVQHNGWSPEKISMLAKIEFPVQQISHLNLMYQTHHACIISDVEMVKDWLSISPGYEPLSYLAAPICVDDEVIGFLNLDSMTRNHFTADHAYRLQAFVNHAAVALRNAQMFKQSQYLAALEERQRLARDLHDSVTQTLFAASVTSNAIIKQWRQDSTSIGDDLLELRDLTQGASAEMRTLLLELRPNALLDSNLSDLLGQLAKTVKGRARLNVQFETQGHCLPPPPVQITLFRVAQEALNNVIKHARAKNLHLQLKCEDQSVQLLIRDDGRGFNLEQTSPRHFGIKIMKERAAEAGISLEIFSNPGQGTSVKAIWSNKDVL